MSLLKSLRVDFEVEIQQAKNGSISSSKFLMGNAAKLLNEQAILPPALRAWLIQGLFEVANTEGNKVNANSAFNLNARPGKNNKHSDDWREMIAKDIHDSGLGLHKGESIQAGKLGAYTKAAADYGISPNTAATIYKEYRAGFELDDELRR